MERNTIPVSDAVFREVYDSPASLPGKHRWVTACEDVRAIEQLLGIPEKTIGAPLWLSADHRHCPKCQREISWLDIVSSALEQVHSKAMIAHPQRTAGGRSGIGIGIGIGDRGSGIAQA